MEKLIAKTYKVAGVTHYQDAILALASENPDYDLTRLELIEEDHTDEKIWKYEFFPSQVQLIPEPDNPHDSHAVKVLVDGEHVGYIKSGSCSHILKQLQAGRIRSIEAEIGGGPYKCLSEDEEDSYTLEKDRIEFFVHLTVRELTEVPDQPEAPEAPRPAAPAGPFCWNCGAPLNPGAAYCVKCGAARNRPAPAPAPRKKSAPWWIIPVVILGAFAAFVLFAFIMAQKPDPAPQQPAATVSATTEAPAPVGPTDMGPYEIHAYSTAQQMVLESLASPTTAEFCWTDECTFRRYDTMFSVSGYVDSQNKLGAMIRSKWTAEFIVDDLETWDKYLPLYLKIGDHSEGSPIDWDLFSE